MSKPITYASIILCFLVAILLQANMYQDWDLLFALEGAKRLLAGGTYLNDMFDNNPPLIYYFAMLCILLANFLTLSSVLVFKLLTGIIVLYCLIMSANLLNRYPNQYSSGENNGILCLLAFCLTIIPTHCVGEREHLMIALTLPYFFLLYKMAIGSHFSKSLRFIIGFLAAIGFAFKPYFLLSWLFADILFAYWQKSVKTLFRLENWVLVFFIVAYLASIAIFMPSYYTDILPLVLDFYAFNNNQIGLVIMNVIFINCLLVILSLILFAPSPKPLLMQLFLVVNLGFLGSYLIQSKGWYYHLLPSVTITLLLILLFSYQILNRRISIKSTLLPSKLTSPKVTHFIVWAILLAAQIPFLIAPLIKSYSRMIGCYVQQNCEYPPLVNLAHKYAKDKSIFIFSTNLGFTFSIAYYAELQLGSRFPTMWLISGILNREHALEQCDTRCQKAKMLVKNYLIEDFQRYQPELVFVDVAKKKDYINIPFEYLAFMQEAPAFKALWKNYSYLTRYREFEVYKRIN